MNSLLTELKKIQSKLEALLGVINFLAVFRRYDLDGKWDLILGGSSIKKTNSANVAPVYNFLIKYAPTVAEEIADIYLLTEGDTLYKFIRKKMSVDSLGEKHDWVLAPDIVISHAHILRYQTTKNEEKQMIKAV